MELSDLSPLRTTLSNGLRLVAVPMPHVHRSVLEAQIRTGSRFESQATNGVSHFLEHMLYRGTPSYPSAHEQALAFETLGGTLFAATAKDFGSMQIAMPPEQFEEVLPLFSEVYQEPCYNGLNIERGIVSEEILESLDESGNVIDADDLIAEMMFPGHPLSYPITGTSHQLQRFDVPLLTQHHARFYVGKTTTIVAAGPFDPSKILKRLESLFSGLPAGESQTTSPPPKQKKAKFRYVEHAASQTSVRMGFRAPSFLAPEEAATQLLVRLLDDGLSTRLYEHICDRKGLCYDVAAGYEAYEDTGLVDLSADSSSEKAAEVLGELFNVVRRLRDSGPTESELDKAKRRHGWQLRQILDDPEEVASHYGLAELTGTRQEPNDRKAQMSAVTVEQVREAATSLFRPESLNVVAVGGRSKRVKDQLRRLTTDFQ